MFKRKKLWKSIGKSGNQRVWLNSGKKETSGSRLIPGSEEIPMVEFDSGAWIQLQTLKYW